MFFFFLNKSNCSFISSTNLSSKYSIILSGIDCKLSSFKLELFSSIFNCNFSFSEFNNSILLFRSLYLFFNFNIVSNFLVVSNNSVSCNILL